jgi:hypothetical protein
MRNKTKVEKDRIRDIEKYIHSQLTRKILTTRMKTKTEIFTDDIDTILKVFMIAQEKYENLGLYSDFTEKIEFDDKCYEVSKILGEKIDELDRVQYEVLWSDGSKTWEFKSALEGEDHKGKWVVAAYKDYLNKKKKTKK